MLVARCNQTARLKLAGVLTQLPDRRHHRDRRRRTFRLGPITGHAIAGRRVTLTIKLPTPATVALAAGAKESAVFRLTATNANAVANSMTRIKRLVGRR